MAWIALLPLLLILVRFTGSVSAVETNSIRCRAVVESWANRELAILATARASRRADPLQLKQLLFFLHIPRTGGRTYHQCFLKNLYSNDERCARSYDELRIDTSAPNCRFLSSHDDYSLITKLPENSTSVVTNLRNPLDRILSTYEFSVEVASRYLKPQPSALRLQSVRRASARRFSAGRQIVSTLDIWPWKYLVPLLQSDVFMRRDLRQNATVLVETGVVNTYDVPSMVMPLHEFIHHPMAMDLVHNGATFQVAGLTNNSALEEAGFIRDCVNSYDTLAKLVLDVAKGRLDEMLYVGLTEKHQESAVMFATVLGSQLNGMGSVPMIPTHKRHSKFLKHIKSDSWAGISALKEHKPNVSHTLRAGETAQQVESDDDRRHFAVEEQKRFIDNLLKSYHGCVANLQTTQLVRRMTTLKFIKPVNFSKEHRGKIPEETVQEIYTLNALDVELFKHAEKIFEKQQLVVNQPDFLEKRMLNLELEHWRQAQSSEVSINEELLRHHKEGSSSDGLQEFLPWGTVITLVCVSAALVGSAVVFQSFRRHRWRDRNSPRVHRVRDVTPRPLRHSSYYGNGTTNMKEKVDAPRFRQ